MIRIANAIRPTSRSIGVRPCGGRTGRRGPPGRGGRSGRAASRVSGSSKKSNSKSVSCSVIPPRSRANFDHCNGFGGRQRRFGAARRTRPGMSEAAAIAAPAGLVLGRYRPLEPQPRGWPQPRSGTGTAYAAPTRARWRGPRCGSRFAPCVVAARRRSPRGGCALARRRPGWPARRRQAWREGPSRRLTRPLSESP